MEFNLGAGKMEEEIRDCWWELIYIIADELKDQKIIYSFNASTSLFVHEIEFNIDDIDITVQWNCFEKAHKCFQKYGASPIIEGNFSEFHFIINCFKVHIISSKRIIDLSIDKERVRLEREDHILWPKTLQSCRCHLNIDNPSDLIDVF